MHGTSINTAIQLQHPFMNIYQWKCEEKTKVGMLVLIFQFQGIVSQRTPILENK